MNRFSILLLLAVVLCLMGAQTAGAQNIAVYQGSGQLICNQCGTIQVLAGVSPTLLQQFDPLYVKVTDNSGNPIPNASVTWAIPTGGQYLNIPSNLTTLTDANGIASILITAPYLSDSKNGAFQSTVTATLNTNASNPATFTLTQTSTNALGTDQILRDFYSNPNGTAPVPGDTLTGQAGSSGNAFTIGIQGSGTALTGGNSGLVGPIAGISVRLINYQASPTVTCATGAGADPGSVLTDSTGYATCTPVFAGSGRGQFAILVGGVVLTTPFNGAINPPPPIPPASQPPYVGIPPTTDPNAPQTTYAGFAVTAPVNLVVSPAAVGSIQLVSGNNQSANQGQAVGNPLVAVVSSTGGAPLAGQAVTWSVSPANAAVLSNTSTTTDINGKISTNVSFTGSASGVVTVTATSGGKTFTFNLNALVPTTFSGLTAVSGTPQSAAINAPFANPLVVQLTTSSGSAANQNVQFSVSGPATISANSAVTDNSGRAQITATAGSSAGTATVTATAGGYSATFTLTVIPAGPQLTAGSFQNGADFQLGSISPCSIATIFANGLAPNVQGVVISNPLGIGTLNYTVANDTVTVGGAQAPIYNVANQNGKQQITFQVPCTVTPGSNVPVIVTVGGGSATVNVTVLPASPGVFQTSNNVNVTGLGTLPLAAIMKRDGTFISPQNPAHIGETVFTFVTGLGPTSPAVSTNALPIFGTPSTVTGTVIVGIQNAGVPVTFAQLSEDMIGVYLVAFQIPTGTPTGNDVFSIGLVPTGSSTAYYSNPAAIYIQ